MLRSWLVYLDNSRVIWQSSRQSWLGSRWFTEPDILDILATENDELENFITSSNRVVSRTGLSTKHTNCQDKRKKTKVILQYSTKEIRTI